MMLVEFVDKGGKESAEGDGTEKERHDEGFHLPRRILPRRVSSA